MEYVNNQSVAVVVIEKKRLAERTVQPGQSIELNPETTEIVTEDAT